MVQSFLFLSVAVSHTLKGLSPFVASSLASWRCVTQSYIIHGSIGFMCSKMLTDKVQIVAKEEHPSQTFLCRYLTFLTHIQLQRGRTEDYQHRFFFRGQNNWDSSWLKRWLCLRKHFSLIQSWTIKKNGVKMPNVSGGIFIKVIIIWPKTHLKYLHQLEWTAEQNEISCSHFKATCSRNKGVTASLGSFFMDPSRDC